MNLKAYHVEVNTEKHGLKIMLIVSLEIADISPIVEAYYPKSSIHCIKDITRGDSIVAVSDEVFKERGKHGN